MFICCFPNFYSIIFGPVRTRTTEANLHVVNANRVEKSERPGERDASRQSPADDVEDDDGVSHALLEGERVHEEYVEIDALAQHPHEAAQLEVLEKGDERRTDGLVVQHELRLERYLTGRLVRLVEETIDEEHNAHHGLTQDGHKQVEVYARALAS